MKRYFIFFLTALLLLNVTVISVSASNIPASGGTVESISGSGWSEISKTTITLTNIYESETVTIVLKHAETGETHTVEFHKYNGYTTVVDLPSGNYYCTSLKTDTDTVKLVFPDNITVEYANETMLSIDVDETLKTKTLKDIFMDNIFFLVILLILIITLVVKRKSMEQI